MARSTGPDLTDDHRKILEEFLDDYNQSKKKKDVVETAFEQVKSALPDYDEATKNVPNVYHWIKV